jgi:hypothetical protein
MGKVRKINGLLAVVLGCSGAASVLFAAPAYASSCTDSWVGPTSGVQSWSVAANWSNGVPDYYTLGPNGDHSNACIDLPGTYTVDLATAGYTYLNTIDIGAASGTQTLRVDGGADLDVSSASAISAHGAIALNSTADGSAILTAGVYTGGAGTLSVASGGVLSTSGATSTASVSVPITNAAGGTLNFAAPVTNLRFNALITNHGAVTVNTGAVLDLTSGASFTNAAGTLTVNGTFQMADGTFTASGGTESGNPVTLTGGTLADSAGTGAFDVTGSSTFYGDIPAGQTVTVDGVANNVVLVVPGAPAIHGTLTLKPAAGFAGLGAQNGNGSLSVASGGVLSSSGAAGSALALVDIPVTNTAGGTVSIGAPSTVFRYGAQVSNSGTVRVSQGGHLDMSGTTLTNTATGTVGVTVNATNATTSGISGAVTAAGTLAVQTIGSPALGSTFVPITGPVSGTFAAFAFGSHAYTVTYPSGAVQLTTAKPAPALTVWRPSSGTWYVRGKAPVALGRSGDKPVPGDYNGDGRTDVAVWRPSTGKWYVHGRASVVFGRSGDKPVPGDYNGDGRTDLAVFRPSNGTWHVRGHATVVYGTRSGDKPVPGDYNGDGRTDLAVFRPSNGTWHVRGHASVVWGRSGDVPVGPFVR